MIFAGKENGNTLRVFEFSRSDGVSTAPGWPGNMVADVCFDNAMRSLSESFQC
jgi:hypothetical protein